MKKNLFIMYITPIAVLAFVFALHYRGQVLKLEEDISRLSVELAHAQIHLEPTIIHDSIPVVTQTVVEVARKDLVDALATERQLIKDLQLKVKQLEAVQTTVVQTIDTVPAQYQARDSIYTYNDQWANISLDMKDSTFYYNIRDSLATVVYREYRHRFLWWRWGTKGYKVSIVNFNPHAHVIYNKYIKAGK